jgi:hypothetical protein
LGFGGCRTLWTYHQGGTHCHYFKGKKIVSPSLQQKLEGLLEELHDAACTCLGRKQHIKSLVKTKQIGLRVRMGLYRIQTSSQTSYLIFCNVQLSLSGFSVMVLFLTLSGFRVYEVSLVFCGCKMFLCYWWVESQFQIYVLGSPNWKVCIHSLPVYNRSSLQQLMSGARLTMALGWSSSFHYSSGFSLARNPPSKAHLPRQDFFLAVDNMDSHLGSMTFIH